MSQLDIADRFQFDHFWPQWDPKNGFPGITVIFRTNGQVHVVLLEKWCIKVCLVKKTFFGNIRPPSGGPNLNGL